MKVLVAMSGGVDSSVAAALLVADGHKIVGATMKLWGGESDSGCCSVSDVEDARRVAQQLGVTHHVFNFGDDFTRTVVDPYVAAHADGRTPNPCVECNRHIKFDRFLVRARHLGFDAVATGHHARVERDSAGSGYCLRRGADADKDQSYVLHMLDQGALSQLLLPVGTMTKAEVRAHAARLSLRTATKPDSQDVCFIKAGGGLGGGRATFLGDRIPLRPGRMVESGTGRELGTVPAIEMVTVGQRRGMGVGPEDSRRYAVDVDVAAGVVTVGGPDDLLTDEVSVDAEAWTWTGPPVAPGEVVIVQTSAHGTPIAGWFESLDRVRLTVPQRRTAPGQSVVLYDGATGQTVLGGTLATRCT